ncbi:hypothetical protein D3C77_574650 [compost metagenome]
MLFAGQVNEQPQQALLRGVTLQLGKLDEAQRAGATDRIGHQRREPQQAKAIRCQLGPRMLRGRRFRFRRFYRSGLCRVGWRYAM